MKIVNTISMAIVIGIACLFLTMASPANAQYLNRTHAQYHNTAMMRPAHLGQGFESAQYNANKAVIWNLAFLTIPFVPQNYQIRVVGTNVPAFNGYYNHNGVDHWSSVKSGNQPAGNNTF